MPLFLLLALFLPWMGDAALYTRLYSGGLTSGWIGDRTAATAKCAAIPSASGCPIVVPLLVYPGDTNIVDALIAAGVPAGDPVYDSSDRLISSRFDSDILDAFIYETFPNGTWYGASSSGAPSYTCSGWTTNTSCALGAASLITLYDTQRPCSELLTLPCLCASASTLTPTTPTAPQWTFGPTAPTMKSPTISPTTSIPTSTPTTSPNVYTKVLGTGTNGTARLAQTLSITPDAQYLAAGATGDSGGLGAIWTYNKTSSGTFTQLGTKITNAGSGALGYGLVISSDGTFLISGSPGENSNTGRLRIYSRSVSTWTEYTSALNPAGASAGANFGSSCAGNQNLTKICCSGPNDGNGKVWCYTRVGTVWTQFGSTILSPGSPPSKFGQSIAMTRDGTMLIVGSPGTSSDAGAVYYYDCSGASSCTYVATFPSTTLQLGSQVAMSGDGKMFIASGGGRIYAYKYSASTWTRVADIGSPDGEAGFGDSIALSYDGSIFIIGSASENLVGRGYLFRNLTLMERIDVTGEIGQGQVGYSAALGANHTVVLGGPNDNSGVGAFWTFTIN